MHSAAFITSLQACGFHATVIFVVSVSSLAFIGALAPRPLSTYAWWLIACRTLQCTARNFRVSDMAWQRALTTRSGRAWGSCSFFNHHIFCIINVTSPIIHKSFCHHTTSTAFTTFWSQHNWFPVCSVCYARLRLVIDLNVGRSWARRLRKLSSGRRCGWWSWFWRGGWRRFLSTSTFTARLRGVNAINCPFRKVDPVIKVQPLQEGPLDVPLEVEEEAHQALAEEAPEDEAAVEVRTGMRRRCSSRSGSSGAEAKQRPLRPRVCVCVR